jgi:hypothetical protein
VQGYTTAGAGAGAGAGEDAGVGAGAGAGTGAGADLVIAACPPVTPYGLLGLQHRATVRADPGTGGHLCK